MIEFLLYIRVLDLVTTHYKVVKIGVTDLKLKENQLIKQESIVQVILVIYIKLITMVKENILIKN